jgi:hypothetical protein
MWGRYSRVPPTSRTNKFAIDVQLWDRWPCAVLLDGLTQPWVVHLRCSSTRTELRYQLAGSNKMVDSHLQALAERRPASIAEQLASEAHHFKQCHPAHAPRPAHSPPRTRPDACVRVSRLVGCTAISDSSTGTGGKHEAAIALRQGLWQVLLTGQRLSAASSSRILMAQEQMQPVHSAKS